jgi:hypothetical protein
MFCWNFRMFSQLLESCETPISLFIAQGMKPCIHYNNNDRQCECEYVWKRNTYVVDRQFCHIKYQCNGYTYTCTLYSWSGKWFNPHLTTIVCLWHINMLLWLLATFSVCEFELHCPPLGKRFWWCDEYCFVHLHRCIDFI